MELTVTLRKAEGAYDSIRSNGLHFKTNVQFISVFADECIQGDSENDQVSMIAHNG